MGIRTKTFHDRPYRVLNIRNMTIYLGSANSGDSNNFNTKNLERALKYAGKDLSAAIDVYSQLLSMLPQGKTKEYRQKLARLNGSRR